jgi:two-component system, chemotaxis family, chemotaxis protein CheY
MVIRLEILAFESGTFFADREPTMFSALIIDDDPIQLRIAELLLKKYGSFTSSTYLSAGMALDYLKKYHNDAHLLPDVIFIDLHMPKTDGWEFLNIYESIRPNLCKSIRVFIVTSSIDVRDHNRSFNYSFVNGFISKPVTSEKLGDIVNGLTKATL